MDLPTPSGREQDVLIRNYCIQNPVSGEWMTTDMIEVFADHNMQPVIAGVAGVMLVTQVMPTKYVVMLDPRYDREILKKEITAQILCAAPQPKEHA
jgi:hypothetical protein